MIKWLSCEPGCSIINKGLWLCEAVELNQTRRSAAAEEVETQHINFFAADIPFSRSTLWGRAWKETGGQWTFANKVVYLFFTYQYITFSLFWLVKNEKRKEIVIVMRRAHFHVGLSYVLGINWHNLV